MQGNKHFRRQKKIVTILINRGGYSIDKVARVLPLSIKDILFLLEDELHV